MPITLQTSDGLRLLDQISELGWVGPATLRIKGVMQRSLRDPVEEVSIELDLRAQQRNGELTVLNRTH